MPVSYPHAPCYPTAHNLRFQLHLEVALELKPAIQTEVNQSVKIAPVRKATYFSFPLD